MFEHNKTKSIECVLFQPWAEFVSKQLFARNDKSIYLILTVGEVEALKSRCDNNRNPDNMILENGWKKFC